MFKLDYIRNFGLRKVVKNLYSIRKLSSSSTNDDNNLDKKPDANKKKDQKTNRESAEKLNQLLQKIVQEDKVNKKSTIQLAQPKKRERKLKHKTSESVESAAKSVAESLGGDVKKTESELLMKLLNIEQAETESSEKLQDIIKGMKIDHETKAPDQKSRAQQVKQILNRRQTQQFKLPERKTRRMTTASQGHEAVVKMEKIDLFGSQRLGIFTEPLSLKEGVSNKTWEKLYQRDLKLAVTHPPANYFQQMILWTEQGKLWKFPIDNEQGLEKEKQVCFSEHVFLEKHLEHWCPQRGPIRHFMELVCVGLSKNPYITVDMKKEHLDWYKNYFESKRKLLEDVGAFPKQQTKEKKQHHVSDK